MDNDEKYYAVGMPVRYSWGGPANIHTGTIVENSEYKRGFYVIKDDQTGYKYNVRANRILGYNTTDISGEEKEDEETLKDFMNRIYGKSDFIQPFLLGDLVTYKDASKPEMFTVIDRLEFKDPAGNTAYSYRIKRTAKDGQDIVNLVDHDRLVKVDKQYRGRYIYPVGARVRFKFSKRELIGYIQERYQDGRYEIRVENQTYVIKQDSILGYAANWIDDPSIRKAFGLDVNKNNIYEDIKKQINKDQLNFHYGLHSIFKLAPNDAAVPSELSEKEKEYVRNDAADSLSYSLNLKRKLEEAYSKAEDMYGLKFNQTFYDDILKYVNEDKMSINDIRKMIGMEPIKEDNKMKKEQKKRNRNIIKTEKYQRTIKDITFNGPAVIVKFEPTGEDLSYGRFKGDKVVVVCKDGDKYDMKTGFLLAILKEFLNNQSYGNVLEKLDSFDALDIPQVGKEWNENIINPDADKVDNWKFMIGDLVRLKSGNVIFKVVRTCTWKFGDGIVHRYAIQRLGGSKYITYENENRLTLVEPTTGRLMKSIIKE